MSDRPPRVYYAGEPDVVHELDRDGQQLLFGRDDEVCDVVVWAAINDTELSRVAGRIWRMEGQLWIRNLSTHHDLTIVPSGSPPDAPLPARRGSEDPGSARSLPNGISLVRGPGGCELITEQSPVTAEVAIPSVRHDENTQRVPPIPGHLREVATALCEPLLAGGQFPATYAEIAERVSIDSVKRVRLLVAELCETYRHALPPTAESSGRPVDEAGAAPAPVRQQGGVWIFETSVETSARRRNLNLPSYYEVALLLVRRGLVGAREHPPETS